MSTTLVDLTCSGPDCHLIMEPDDALFVDDKAYCYDHYESAKQQQLADDYIERLLSSPDEEDEL